MGALEFVSNLIDTIVWPVVAVFAIVLFKGQIKSMVEKLENRIPHLKSLKAGPLEGEFLREAISDVVDAVEQPVHDGATSGRLAELSPERRFEIEQGAIVRNYEELLVVEPRTALILAAANVKITLLRVYKRTTPGFVTRRLGNGGEHPSSVQMLGELVENGRLPESAAEGVINMFKIRDFAMANPEMPIDYSMADEFRRGADEIIRQLSANLAAVPDADSEPVDAGPDSTEPDEAA